MLKQNAGAAMSALEAAFIGVLITLTYIYFGYPFSVLIFSKWIRKEIRRGEYAPQVTIVISAFNEEGSIGETIRNKLSLNYPEKKLEIIVVSDGSTDRTDEIVKSFISSNVRFFRQEPRGGKTSALNLAVREAKGEIIVFSDANSIYDREALRHLMSNFNDPTIGYVTGKMIYANPDGSMIGDGCSAYMKYENFLRSKETLIGSIVGVDGGIDAVKKELYRPMMPHQLPDFVLPLSVVQQGYRVVYEPNALLKEQALSAARDEYKMRVRVSLRSLWTLMEMKSLFNLFRYGWFSWQLFSHKLLRYAAFGLMLALYVLNGFLLGDHRIYQLFFFLQTLFHTGSYIGYLLQTKKWDLRLFYIPFYFSLINIAAGHAFLKFLKGEKQALWVPRKG